MIELSYSITVIDGISEFIPVPIPILGSDINDTLYPSFAIIGVNVDIKSNKAIVILLMFIIFLHVQNKRLHFIFSEKPVYK